MSNAAQVGLPGVEAQRGDVGSDACFTPKYIIDGVIGALGYIDTDPCWHPDSHVPDCAVSWRYDGRRRGDGLTSEWFHKLWMNCPYSDPLPWALRFAVHAHEGNRCIALVKCDPSTKWWKAITRTKPLIGLVDHRIKFEGAFAGGGSPEFASAFIASGIPDDHLRRHLPMATWMRVV